MNKEYIDYIEQNITNTIERLKYMYPQKLYEAINYSVFSGGKRIRPYLMLLSAQFIDIECEKVINQAIALELIHTYSLIHDDLPSMDNDDFRRGKPSCHKKFGEATAILAGDALLNLAYEILFNASMADSALIKSCAYISASAGGLGMIGGQALEFENCVPDLKLYEKICYKKTGALFNAAIMSPTYIKCSNKEYNALEIYSECIGYIFQYTDDLLDKGKDEISILSFIDKEKVCEKIIVLNKKAVEAVSSFGEKAQKLIDLCNFLTKRTF